MTAIELLAELQNQGVTLSPLPGGKLEVRPASKLSNALREELRQRKAEILALLQSEEVTGLRSTLPAGPQPQRPASPPAGSGTIYGELAYATPPSMALEVFPDWQGLLIKSAVLEMSVWVVRSRQDGKELARETGHPALLLDDVLAQRGRNAAEARAALLPVLIVPMQ